MTAEIESIKKAWYERNPVHETNCDTGDDMFWETVKCVFDDLYATRLAELEKKNKELREGHKRDVMDAYTVGTERYFIRGSENKFNDAEDYYTKPFNNEKS
jgi:hypothetical protein